MACLAFDVYGTLIDPLSMETALAAKFGANAAKAAALWRQKQLEYSFRRAAMASYANFDLCTAQALEFVCQTFQVELDPVPLLEQYRRLPAYDGVAAALETLGQKGHRIVAFSNGTESSVRALLDHAGVLRYFESVISVDAVRTFKPAPQVYQFLVRTLSQPAATVRMISSNPFDVIGAKAAGLSAIWLRRDPAAVFDPWGIAPDATIENLEELPRKVL